jgi:hypothetical protein
MIAAQEPETGRPARWAFYAAAAVYAAWLVWLAATAILHKIS